MLYIRERIALSDDENTEKISHVYTWATRFSSPLYLYLEAQKGLMCVCWVKSELRE